MTYMFALMGIQSSPAFSMWAFANKTSRAFRWQQVVASSVVIGIILFMIMQPGTGPDGFWGDDVDGSFGFIIWFVLIYSIIVPIVSKFEVDFS